MMRVLPRTLAQVLLVAVVGCAHTPPIGPDAFDYPERRDYLSELEGWSMRGRIAVDTGEEAFQGRFQWQQSADTLELSIRGPLGVGVLQIAGPTNQLTVRARGDTWLLTDPETELSALLGWWLPVESFNAWLLGHPDPAFDAETTLGPDNALQSIEQRRWALSYDSYQLADEILMPRRIDLAHQDLELRVIVDRWQRVSED
ncbi:MAG: lipoprotein insertase outer membrane protein LolB [Candidatus Rariloculaceae bacterium]